MISPVDAFVKNYSKWDDASNTGVQKVDILIYGKTTSTLGLLESPITNLRYIQTALNSLVILKGLMEIELHLSSLFYLFPVVRFL